jgi:HAE1 family hydrophobic/amphiphilic exporter-1
MFVGFFIRRPIFATVCSLLIILAGGAAIPTLPIAQFPNLAPPQVFVQSNYIGASAQVVETAVTIPLEQQINGAEGLRHLTSSSGNDGTSQIIATFDVTRDPDLAAVDVQNRVNFALGRLPNEVKQTGVFVAKSSQNFVFGAAVFSPDERYDPLFMSNYLDVYVRDSLKRVKGVADVLIFGERRYAMRLWLDPARMASRGLTAPDVLGALREQNVQVAAGQVGQPPAPDDQSFQISVRAVGRLREASEFEGIIVKGGADGTLVRLKDVGRVELGAEDYGSVLQFNGHDAVGIAVTQLSNANALEVGREAFAELDRLAKAFPPGMEFHLAWDATEIVGESIREVVITLGGAILLVVLVMFLFLEDWRATLIPAATIPVSLLGAFAFVKLFGFSINTLTLFAIVLATGLVVDDAIVVIENIARHVREGERDAVRAASVAMREVTGAVIATTLVLIAVFVPVALFPGTTGILYRQFALTIAFSLAISSFNALTLTPALSALLLGRGERPKGWFFSRVDRLIEGSTRGYVRGLRRFLGRRRLALALFFAGLGLTYLVYQQVPRAFVPDEDQGWGMLLVQAPEGASLAYTARIAEQVQGVLQGIPEVDTVFSVSGFSFAGLAPNRGMMFFGLDPYSERPRAEQSAQAVIQRLYGMLGGITGAIVIPFLPPAVEGLGSFGGFQYVLQDQGGHTLEQLAQTTQQLVREGNADPALTGLFTSFTANDPQLVLSLDREKAKALDVPLEEITQTLQVYMGSAYVNDFDFNNRSYRVYVQADERFRSNPRDLRQYYVRSRSGRMLPLEELVEVRREATSQVINHYNLFRSTEINGAAAPGRSSGEAIAAMEALSRRVLPQGFSYEWTGLSREELEAGATSAILFALGALVVYLALCAQYESFVLPFIVLLAVPMALLGAVAAQWLRGLQNDVYCQIGLVMLVGLASKNSILIVEFAEQLRGRGLPIVEAAIEASRIRLRPILMTSFAFILGVLPLALAHGAGQAGRHSVGTTVFGGMIASTLLNLYLIPVLYVVVEQARAGRGADARR